MPKKLNIDILSSEMATVKDLLISAINSNDIVGEMQLNHRLKNLVEKIEELKKNYFSDNSASVALFFGGHPVIGSKGIASEFAGLALEQFQNLVAKMFATNELGELGQRGKVPFKSHSELMITGLARGSFGFILDEMSEQVETETTQLKHVVNKAVHLLKNTASQDESVFEAILEDLDSRSLIALKDFFSNLDSNKATIRLVERDLDFTLDGSAIHRARMRTEATSIEEKTTEIEGILVGFLPEHRKFELRDNSGKIIYGSATKNTVEQFEKTTEITIGKKCLAKVTVKTIAPLNRPPREIVRLIDFLKLGE